MPCLIVPQCLMWFCLESLPEKSWLRLILSKWVKGAYAQPANSVLTPIAILADKVRRENHLEGSCVLRVIRKDVVGDAVGTCG